MNTKDDCKLKYVECKASYKRIPLKDEFYKFAKIPERQLVNLYGRNAYTKLQEDCGDDANKLNLERTPRETIMRQYGDLAVALKELPNSSDWIHRQLRPGISGLERRPHFIKWSEFPMRFKEWVEAEGINGYEKVLGYINQSVEKSQTKNEKRDGDFEKVLRDIRMWSPGRRRNSEGEYKVELKKHLEALGYDLNEEFEESNFDLLIDKKYAVEIKKEPQLSEYDRLFGQLARHLQHQPRIIALVFDPPSEDKFRNFVALVDAYLNKGDTSVEVIKK